MSPDTRASDARESSQRSPALFAREPECRSNPDLEESVAILDCGQRPPVSGYRAASALVERASPTRGPLLLVLRCLERLDGSLTGFILGLESILRSSSRPVLLGDPSGLVPLVLASSAHDRRLRPLPQSGQPGTVLVVSASPSVGAILAAVLEAFGRTCVLAHSGQDARAAIARERFDAAVLDLDLPGLQAYAVAECLKSRGSAAVPIGLTGNDEAWTLEICVRYGLRRILPKPYSVADIVGLISEPPTRRGS